MSRYLLFAAIVAAAWISPASAQQVSGVIGVVSDYRERGLSLSAGRPAVQWSLSFEHESGWYAEAWYSTLGRGGFEAGEADLTAGFAEDVSQSLGIDVYGTYVTYPGALSESYVEVTAAARVSRGDASARFGVSFIPPQPATDDANNAYAFAQAELPVPRTALTLAAAIGFERGAFDAVDHGGKWDWSIGSDIALGPATIGIAYVGSNVSQSGRHALVASLLRDF